MCEKLKVEDFICIPDHISHDGCGHCFFWRKTNDDEEGFKECTVDDSEVGMELEKINGSCTDDDHYYKLKNKE